MSEGEVAPSEKQQDAGSGQPSEETVKGGVWSVEQVKIAGIQGVHLGRKVAGHQNLRYLGRVPGTLDSVFEYAVDPQSYSEQFIQDAEQVVQDFAENLGLEGATVRPITNDDAHRLMAGEKGTVAPFFSKLGAIWTANTEPSVKEEHTIGHWAANPEGGMCEWRYKTMPASAVIVLGKA